MYINFTSIKDAPSQIWIGFELNIIMLPGEESFITALVRHPFLELFHHKHPCIFRVHRFGRMNTVFQTPPLVQSVRLNSEL